MTKSKLRVAIIAGGNTSEHDSSLTSGLNVYELLRFRFDVALVEFRFGQWSILAPTKQIDQIATDSLYRGQWFHDEALDTPCLPDVAFLCTHGAPGESGELQGWLELVGIPYCSSGVLASALSFNKLLCSQSLSKLYDVHIPHQQFIAGKKLLTSDTKQLDSWIPFVLKPISLGSSLGVVSVHDSKAIGSALSLAASMSCDYILEEYIDGVEITSGAVRFGNEIIVFPASRVFRSPDLDDLGLHKYTNHKLTTLSIATGSDVPDQAFIREYMIRIGIALNLRGFYRVDFIWSHGKLFFLEVNTIPGMSKTSALTQLVNQGGYDFASLLARLIETHSVEA